MKNTVIQTKIYRDYFLTEESYIKYIDKLNKKIETFDNKFMNNSKWKKVFMKIYSNVNIIKQCEAVDFFSSCINILNTNLQNPQEYIFDDFVDNKIFIAGEYSISYREIEYLEFKKSWEGEYIGRLVNPKILPQDINKIKKTISEIGKFQWEEGENYLRLIGYK
jgi:hypothetical protein